MITISKNALHHLLDLMESEGLSPDTHNLRVGVTAGGCSGYLTKWILMIK